MKLSNLVAALKARGIPEEVAKSAAIDVEDHADESGMGGGRQEGMPVGPGRGAHGDDADRQVRMSSDFGRQGMRQNEYEAYAAMLSTAVTKAVEEAMKAKTPAPAAKAGDDTILGQFGKTLKMAKSAVFKAEMDDEDEDEDGEKDMVEKAEKLLVKAKKLLAKAEEEDEDGEDEEKMEKARSEYSKVAKSLKAVKAERAEKAAAVAKAKADEAAALAKAEADKAAAIAKAEADAKAAADLEAAKSQADKDAEVLKAKMDETIETVKGFGDLHRADVKEIINMISNVSRHSSIPPDLTVKKGSLAENTDTAPNFAAMIVEASDAGRLNMSETIKAKSINSHLGLVKSGAIQIDQVKEEIRGASENIQRVFAPVMAKAAA
jgi:hypothetical protein